MLRQITISDRLTGVKTVGVVGFIVFLCYSSHLPVPEPRIVAHLAISYHMES